MSVPRNELIKGYHRCVVWCLATIRWSADLSGSLPLWSLCQAVDKFRWGTQTYHRESASNSAGKSPAKMIWYFCPEDGFLTTFLMPGPQQKPDTEAVQKKTTKHKGHKRSLMQQHSDLVKAFEVKEAAFIQDFHEFRLTIRGLLNTCWGFKQRSNLNPSFNSITSWALWKVDLPAHFFERCFVLLIIIPVVPHKAVAEVSNIGNLIGEVGCCESGMAERIHWWTERCLRSPTLSRSFSHYLPTYLPIYPSTYLPIYPILILKDPYPYRPYPSSSYPIYF